jgi:hypothetical protein
MIKNLNWTNNGIPNYDTNKWVFSNDKLHINLLITDNDYAEQYNLFGTFIVGEEEINLHVNICGIGDGKIENNENITFFLDGENIINGLTPQIDNLENGTGSILQMLNKQLPLSLTANSSHVISIQFHNLSGFLKENTNYQISLNCI